MNLSKLFALFGAFFIFTGNLYAQDSDENQEEVEEVVVVGIKKSLQDAIDIKRSNTGIVDAITAEDFGKFPDNNLAESLARVVGIGIDRSNVEGEHVAVRGFGPQFNLVTLNGRQMPTAPTHWDDGRSFNFGDISSHGISAVEVYKSTNSSLPSGGIGSTINMVTTKPLDIEGEVTSLSFDLLSDTTNEDDELQPEVNFVHSSNKGNWGWSVSGSFQDRTNREAGTRESNWMTFPDQQANDGYLRVTDAQATVNNNTRADGRTFYQEPSAYQFKDNARERINMQFTTQYEVNDAIVATADYTRSSVDFSSTGQMFGSWLGAWSTAGGTINHNGVWTDVTVGVPGDKRGYDHQYIWGETRNVNESLGFNLAIDASENLKFEIDYHDSSAERKGTELPNEIGLAAPGKAVVTHTNSSSSIHLFDYDVNFGADEYSMGSAYVRDAFKTNEMEQLQFKGEWFNDTNILSFVKSVEFGVSHVESTFIDNRAEEVISLGQGDSVAIPAAIMQSRNMDSLFDGFSFDSSKAVDYYYEIDGGPLRDLFVAEVAALNPGAYDTMDTIDETFDSAFLQFNMEFEINSRPLNVVLGLRHESLDRTSTGLEQSPTALQWGFESMLYDYAPGYAPSAKSGNDEIFLPNIAAAYEFQEDMVVRASFGESMAYPSLNDLRSATAFGSSGYTQPTASGGNPDMAALTAENTDIAFEWYYAEGSYFAINYFKKEIDNFPTSGQSYRGFYGLTNPALGPRADAARACVQAWIDSGSPVGGNAAATDDPASSWYGVGFFNDPVPVDNCVNDRLRVAQPWMNANHLAAVVAANQNAFEQGTMNEWWNEGYWNLEYAYGAGPLSNGFSCYGGFWYCDHANLRGNADDPVASFLVTQPLNLQTGEVDGFEIVLQHLFADTGYGIQFNATIIDGGGDTDIDRYAIGKQFLLPGLGDSGNFSVFYEDQKWTARIALNHRGETVNGFGAYDQPLYVEERNQIDAAITYRLNDQAAVFLELQNLNDETTRLHARHKEMLFLAQDHGLISRLGFRYKF